MSPDDDESIVMERLAEGFDHVVRFHPEAPPSLDTLLVVTIEAPVTGPDDWNAVVTPAFPRLPLGQSWGDYEAGRLAPSRDA
ncbi:hypothetical protein ACIQVO_36770 [Streptomyces sp. NPDC101062]|uniref:hypothetical protein n=1 Tax=unclassified Streptomyces TaxID=2593676 RepID=UPI0037FB37C0